MIKGKDSQLEMESFHLKRMMQVAQINKGSRRKKVETKEEDLTRRVEVEEEVERLSISVTNVTSWVTDLLSVLRMRI